MEQRKKPEVLFSDTRISEKRKEMAKEIEKDYAGKNVRLICVLNGAFMFFADLVREIQSIPVSVGFLSTSSYHGNKNPSGDVAVDFSQLPNIQGEHIILVEDIIDTGGSMRALIPCLWKLRPASIAVASLLSKEEHPEELLGVNVYYCFRKGDHFVVGYGMDYQGLLRNLPNVCTIER